MNIGDKIELVAAGEIEMCTYLGVEDGKHNFRAPSAVKVRLTDEQLAGAIEHAKRLKDRRAMRKK